MIEPDVGGRIVDCNGWTWQRFDDGWRCRREDSGSWVDVPYMWGEMVAVFGPVTAA